LSALPIQHEMTEGKLAHKSTGTVNPIPGLKAEWDGLKISLDIATTTFDDRPVDPNTRAATSRGAP
ncbi:MAG: hypothetical protein QOE71_1382, partial [Pseudonocardiales bacterium]|nr:hypothetical protein [Pseudonocardiales bacterium]